MKQSVRALMNRLIDYAGLFPPAKLDMAQMVQRYANHVASDDAWMLGRLIVPVSRLDEFEDHAKEILPRSAHGEVDPWQLSALAVNADQPEQLAGDVARIEAFNLRHEEEPFGLAIIDVIETKADSTLAIDSALEQIPDDLFPFFELPIDRDPRGLIAALAQADAGAKVRTGGTSADLYPKTEDLARFIFACAAANVPFKTTAGLHHPLRHFSADVNAKEFGFINVFLAACLAQTHELGEGQLRELLEEESAEAFEFYDGAITWREQTIEAASVEDVREEFAICFGSCSFEEPLADLRAIGLL